MDNIKADYELQFANGKIIKTDDEDIYDWYKISRWKYVEDNRDEYNIFLPNGFIDCNNDVFFEVCIILPYLDDDKEVKKFLKDCENENKLYNNMLQYCRWLYPVESIEKNDDQVSKLSNDFLSEIRRQKEINKIVKDRIKNYALYDFNDSRFRDDFNKLLKYVYGEEVLTPENKFVKFTVDEKIDFLRLFILYRISKLTVKGRSVTDLKLYGYQGQKIEGYERTDKSGRAIDIDDMIWNIEKGVLGGTDSGLVSANGKIKQIFYARIWCNQQLYANDYKLIFDIMDSLNEASLMALDSSENKLYNTLLKTDWKQVLSTLPLFGYMIVIMFCMDKILLWKKINISVKTFKENNKEKYANSDVEGFCRMRELLNGIEIKDRDDFINLFYEKDGRLELSEQNEVLSFIFQPNKKFELGNLRKNIKANLDKIYQLYKYQYVRIVYNGMNDVSTAYIMVVVSYLFFKFKNSELPHMKEKNYHKQTSDENVFQSGTQTINRIISTATREMDDKDKKEEWYDYGLYEAIINTIMYPFISTYVYKNIKITSVEDEIEKLIKGSDKMVELLSSIVKYRKINITE